MLSTLMLSGSHSFSLARFASARFVTYETSTATWSNYAITGLVIFLVCAFACAAISAVPRRYDRTYQGWTGGRMSRSHYARLAHLLLFSCLVTLLVLA